VELASKDIHRALAFVSALNDAGYHPTEQALDAYAHVQPPKPLSVFDWIDSFGSGYGNQRAITQYLLYVLWLRHESGGLALTELGRHMLSALDAQSHQVRDAVEIALDPDDPIVLSRVVKRLAEIGPALLVDPYFRLDHLALVLEFTAINEIMLTDAVPEPERNALQHALSTPLDVNRKVEVRVAPKSDIHDRYVIPAHGAVTFIGASLNTVERRPTYIGQVKDAANEVRTLYRSVWQKAKILGVAGPDVTADGL
jgi:hypothetical protein